MIQPAGEVPPDRSASAPVTSAPAAPPAPPLQPRDEDVPTLERNYHDPRNTSEQRQDIVKSIGRDDSPLAVPALRRIFDGEMRMDVRMTVIEVIAGRTDDAGRAQRYDLLSHATEAKQPVAVRLAAMAAIEDLDDPRVLALIRNLTHDPNSMVREDAGRIAQEIKVLRELNQ